MTIRTRLAWQFTLLMALLLGTGLGAVYYLSWHNTRRQYEQRLRERANTAAALFLEADEQSLASTNRARQRFLRNLNGEVIGIFDAADRLRFNTQTDSSFTPVLLARVRRRGEVLVRHGAQQVVGIYYRDNQGDFCILVAAEDYAGQTRLAYLRLVSGGVLLASVVMSFVLGRWFARSALAPISNLVHQAQRVSAADLHLPMPAGEANDELGELSATLNLMLQRLKESFERQKSFVSNASHELRTPLTSIMATLEVALNRPRTPESYVETLQSTLQDAHRLKEIINRLLQMAQLDSREAGLHDGSTMRLDEVLYATCEEVAAQYAPSRIQVLIQRLPADAEQLDVPGDRHLFRLALGNLLSNACKFSAAPVACTLDCTEQEAIITVADQGIGIAPAELAQVRQTFFRASNAQGVRGYGVGLALANQIFELHSAVLEIDSVLHQGTTMRVRLPLARVQS
jgi:signal transduction histidine kinase